MMNKFFIKLSVFTLVILAFCCVAFWQADGYTDPFYRRFTTEQKGSLILGTSRAAQGILPSIVDSAIRDSYPGTDLFNFSFTIAHSPYGPAYYKAVTEKLDPTRSGGIFILAIDPWSISSQHEDPDDSTAFPENKMVLGKIRFFNMKPNVEYLLQHYEKPFAALAFNPFRKMDRSVYLHKDGWLEVNVPMDSTSVKYRTDEKLREYTKDYLPTYNLSKLRLSYFKKTINTLRKHGDVYVVRLPTDPRMIQIEEQLLPSFDSLIAEMCSENKVNYFNIIKSSADYQYTDGNHLYKESSKKVSQEIARLINMSKDSAKFSKK